MNFVFRWLLYGANALAFIGLIIVAEMLTDYYHKFKEKHNGGSMWKFVFEMVCFVCFIACVGFYAAQLF